MKHLRLSEDQLQEIQSRHKGRVHLIPDENQNQQIGHRRSKYNNRRFKDSEGTWDSEKERKRWTELRMLESVGKIQELQKKVSFELIASSFKNHKRLRPIVYIADFVYLEAGVKVVEDTKGFRTKAYKLKRRLMWEKFGIDILET